MIISIENKWPDGLLAVLLLNRNIFCCFILAIRNCFAYIYPIFSIRWSFPAADRKMRGFRG